MKLIFVYFTFSCKYANELNYGVKTKLVACYFIFICIFICVLYVCISMHTHREEYIV